jgi:GNAT superfamily N-acetyltransferase
MSQPANTLVRRAVADDQRFIASTWWHSMLGRNRAPRLRRRINAQIDRVLDDDTTKALVITDAQSGKILGWLVYAQAPVGRVVHYAYVRDDHRGNGFARRLVEAAWPGSTARIVLTMHGPHTRTYLDKHANALHVSIDDFYR